MNSCLYQGVLRHRRLQPKAHHFVYRLFMAWLDLDELDKLPEAGIRRNRLAAAAWYDADYPLGAPLKASAEPAGEPDRLPPGGPRDAPDPAALLRLPF